MCRTWVLTCLLNPKDISNTSDVIQLAQEKIKNFDLNLNSLKDCTKELNIEFNEFTSKVDHLDSAIRNFVLNVGKPGRDSGLNSAADDDDGELLESYDENSNEVFDFQSDGIDDHNQLMDILISNLKKSIVQ